MTSSRERLPRMLGPYVLLEHLGGGAFGATYLARESAGRAPLVIKRLRDDVLHREDLRARLIHEAQVAVTIDDPRVVRAYDVGVVGEVPFVSMEFVEGWPLTEILRASHEGGLRWPPGAVVALIAEILRGLEALHGATHPETGAPLEVVHRDVSPNNVMLRTEGQPVLIDLGLGRSALREWETTTGVSMGTPGYMAPEQIERRVVDHRADLYAVGVLAFELLTLQRFVPPGDVARMLRATCEGAYRPPSEVEPTLPAALDPVIARAVAVAPADRPPSAAALREALCAAVAPLPDAVPHCVPPTLRQLNAVRRASRAVLLIAPTPAASGPQERTRIFASTARRASTALQPPSGTLEDEAPERTDVDVVPGATERVARGMGAAAFAAASAETRRPTAATDARYGTAVDARADGAETRRPTGATDARLATATDARFATAVDGRVDATAVHAVGAPVSAADATIGPWVPATRVASARPPRGPNAATRLALWCALAAIIAGGFAWHELSPRATSATVVSPALPASPAPPPPPPLVVLGERPAAPTINAAEPAPTDAPSAAVEPALTPEPSRTRPAVRVPAPAASPPAPSASPSPPPQRSARSRIEDVIERASRRRRERPDQRAELDAVIVDASTWLDSTDAARVASALDHLEKTLARLSAEPAP